MNKHTIELAKEARRQFENCLYTAAALFEWLKFLRFCDASLSILPIIFSALATWRVFDATENKIAVGIFALLAGLLPIVQRALKLSTRITEVSKAAAEFTNLRDRFRQVATVSVHKDEEELERHFDATMGRMEKARQLCVTAPNWCFGVARKKIKKGIYDADFESSVPAFKHLDLVDAEKSDSNA
ncbi:hypothetical protein [Azospirillum tabaci]|uniref:hypothetical protein n=1 Tax=Azospirillum tabaci TaxID=2752310 RepID=UPI001660C750|nr:hypothetical protein [Azospirillum tabaci]